MRRAGEWLFHGLALCVLWVALALFFVAGCIEAISVLLRARTTSPPVTPEPPSPPVYVREPFIYDTTTSRVVQ